MAKSDFEKALINWNGSVDHPDAGITGLSVPKNVELGSWGDNSYSWDDVSFVIDIVGGIGTGRRRAKEARLNQLDKDKKNRLIRLICRVKGELVYDEEKEVGDVHIKLEDAELVINEVLGKIKVEKADVL